MGRGHLVLPARYDELVDASADIDRFCSSSDWVAPTHAWWGEDEPVVAARGDAVLALDLSRGRWGRRVFCGLDPMWGFACPLVGPDVVGGARLAAEVLVEVGSRWDAALLTGFVPWSPRERAVLAALAGAGRYRIQGGPTMTRRVADLSGGLDAYLARRSGHFRRNARQAERKLAGAGIEVELVRGGGAEVVERCVEVEEHSWKGAEGAGLSEPRFAGFYRSLAERLAGSGRLRAGFARCGERDVGFILGAVRGTTYRGLQLSYHERFAALSLGNVLQLRQMAALVEEGVRTYDLGMDMEYKRRWADGELTTRTLVVLPAG